MRAITRVMTHGHFLWTDLSTYDMAAARSDYAQLFGWRFHGDSAYDFAALPSGEVAAIFPMPDRLAEINMPSFWMSYIHVPDLNTAVDTARSHDGVIIEVEPEAFSEDARIALVRDPSGAGVTLYEGPEITAPRPGHGTVIQRYHHLPEIRLVDRFYSDLFGWTFEKVSAVPWPAYDIRHPNGERVAVAEEVPEAIRGTFRYWMPCFQVNSVADTCRTLSKLGGTVVQDLPDDRAMAADRQGAHFLIRAHRPNA